MKQRREIVCIRSANRYSRLMQSTSVYRGKQLPSGVSLRLDRFLRSTEACFPSLSFPSTADAEHGLPWPLVSVGRQGKLDVRALRAPTSPLASTPNDRCFVLAALHDTLHTSGGFVRIKHSSLISRVPRHRIRVSPSLLTHEPFSVPEVIFLGDRQHQLAS